MGCNRTVTEQDIDQMWQAIPVEWLSPPDIDSGGSGMGSNGGSGGSGNDGNRRPDDEVSDVVRQILEDAEYPRALDASVLARAVENYDELLVRNFVEAYDHAPEYVNVVLDTFNQVSHIEGTDKVMSDLLASSRKAQGAEYELSYIFEHKSEIRQVEVEDVYYTQGDALHTREGIDVVNHDGSVVELKRFNHSSSFYISHASQVAEAVIDQARSRFERGATRVSVVFSGEFGSVSPELAKALDEAIGSAQLIEWRVE